ncbi:helix-turn-helix domain-containing protein [Blautia massiliensis (ex Durand et al. 2017)]|jgi:transcriptional regulator with XRE-family HTH domain|uniref:helix-turn-helix domain-containing protein n=1 Tax=Blautia massiliensis (ex Durand et al. 2017) TaxID=1737424 RepID=UPI0022E2D5FE|nr:helix-turn-helix transcriptional regulator [Blautia massiliensis (ex Durand et al. 2017)]
MCKMAQRIKACRLQYNMTQEELASKLGLKKSAIAKYENGRVENIKRTTIEEMARIFNCNPSYLMGWDEPAKPATLAAHFDGEEYTEDELKEIRQFAEFVKGKRR